MAELVDFEALRGEERVLRNEIGVSSSIIVFQSQSGTEVHLFRLN